MRVSVSGQVNSATLGFVTYAPPTLSAVWPNTSDTAGGAVLSFTGSDLGPPSSPLSINISRPSTSTIVQCVVQVPARPLCARVRLCALMCCVQRTFAQSHDGSQGTCVMGSGAGVDFVFVVGTPYQSTTTAVAFQYEPPTITNVTGQTPLNSACALL